MTHFTTNTYTLKREILSFSNKISRKLSKPDRKFMADMNYGMLASGSCLLMDIVDQLHEDSKKINCVDRFPDMDGVFLFFIRCYRIGCGHKKEVLYDEHP